METIIFKVPDGTKAALRRHNPNLSALLRATAEKVIEQNDTGSAYERVKHLAGKHKGGPRNLSTSKDYLKQYAPKNHR